MFLIRSTLLMMMSSISRTSDSTGDMYINGEFVDYDVYYSSLKYNSDAGKFITYMIDYNDDRESGTLMAWENGKKEKIRDDVYYKYYIYDNGSIVYLYDYSLNRASGELYSWKNGRSNKLDSEVSLIIPYNYV